MLLPSECRPGVLNCFTWRLLFRPSNLTMNDFKRWFPCRISFHLFHMVSRRRWWSQDQKLNMFSWFFMFVWAVTPGRIVFFCFILSTAQGDKHTQQLVECQRALVRAFEGRSSGNSNWGCWASLGGDGLDGYASYAAMPKRERRIAWFLPAWTLRSRVSEGTER